MTRFCFLVEAEQRSNPHVCKLEIATAYRPRNDTNGKLFLDGYLVKIMPEISRFFGIVVSIYWEINTPTIYRTSMYDMPTTAPFMASSQSLS